MPQKALKILALSLALFAGFAAAPAFAHPPHWAPAHGDRGHNHYIYYPHSEVYYSPVRHVWYYRDDEDWRVSYRLPSIYLGDLADGVSIYLDADRPYVDHDVVRERYPYEGRRHHHDDEDDDD